MNKNKFNLELTQLDSYQILLEKRLKENYNITDPIKTLQRLYAIDNILKNMNNIDIIKIYETFYKEIGDLKIEYVFGDDDDREIIEITNPPEYAGRKFYRSSGTSRSYSLLKDFWLPYISIEGSRKLKRFEKPEDKYINAIEYIKDIRASINPEFDKLIYEMLSDDSILKFGRFINYENALISGVLFKNKIERKEFMVGGKKSQKKSSKKSQKKI